MSDVAPAPARPPHTRIRWWRSLQARFLLGAMVAATVFGVAAGLFGYRLGQQRTEAAARATVASLQSAVEKTAAVAVYAHDPTLMREIVEGVARSPLVRRVDIVDPQGRVLMLDAASEARPDDGATFASPDLSVEHRLVSPFDVGETVGVLRIALDGRRLAAVARGDSERLAALMAGQALLIALFVYLAGLRLVSRPIARLAGDLAAMPPGTTDTLPEPPGHAADELGRLVASANALLSANAQALQRERTLRREIEAMEAQYRQIFDSTSAGIFVLDRDGRLINGNPTVLRMIGASVDDLRGWHGTDFLERVFARPERVRQMIADGAVRGETVSADIELRARGGETRWAHCLVSVQEPPGVVASPEDGPSRGAVIEGVLYDITERKRAEHDVRRRAEHDALTGALNRSAIEELVDRCLDPADPHDRMALIYLDLDGFKQVNDRLGHAAGDVVLQETVRRMTMELRRATDVIGRIGGDEFVVVLQHTDAGDVATARLAERLLARVGEPVVLDDGSRVACGVSIGLAGYPRHGRTRRELLHAADEAMFAVKRHGKNAYASALASDA